MMNDPKGAWPRSRVLLLKQWDIYPCSTERISCFYTEQAKMGQYIIYMLNVEIKSSCSIMQWILQCPIHHFKCYDRKLSACRMLGEWLSAFWVSWLAELQYAAAADLQFKYPTECKVECFKTVYIYCILNCTCLTSHRLTVHHYLENKSHFIENCIIYELVH